MKKHLITTLVSTALLTLSTALPAQTTDAVAVKKPAVVKLGTGFDYSYGTYGFTQKTEVSSIPLNLSVEQGRWAFRASQTYLTIKGPASVVAGQAPVAAPGRATTQSQSGLGDPTLSATFHARPVPGEWNVDLTTRVKLGTASVAKGLGTGEHDAYFQMDFYKSYGTFTPFGSVGYRFLGSNTAFPLKDGAYASLGGSFLLGPGTVIGAAFDWRSKIIDGSEDGMDVIGFFATDLSPDWNLLGYILIGFNEATPDFGAGTAITYKF